jgi:hypothetical protein
MPIQDVQGAPVSIPGLPIETASGIKAPQHGNGHAVPNIFVPQMIGSVQVDGGVFNVCEGNHSQNLSATYGNKNSPLKWWRLNLLMGEF